MAAASLVDAGPLIAAGDDRDRHHSRSLDFFATFEGTLLTTWPVLTEVCHMIPRRAAVNFMRSVSNSGVEVREIPQAATTQIADLMEKYADLPMDLADASLVWLADETGVRNVITFDDRDFDVYRLAGGRRFNNLMAATRRR